MSPDYPLIERGWNLDPASATDASAVRGRVRHYPLVYIVLALVVVAALLVWQTVDRLTRFHQYQGQVARNSVAGAANEIGLLLGGLRRAVQLFAIEHQDRLSYIASRPDDDTAVGTIRDRIQSYFPEMFAFTLADTDGTVLIEELPNLVWDQCRQEIRHFVNDNHEPQVHIHPNPEGYHFDIMVPVSLNGAGAGVFFVSFLPDRLSGILAHSQSPGHRLLLLKRGGQPPLVELAAEGARDVLDRASFLKPAEVARVDASQPIPDTLWELVDMPRPRLYLDNALYSSLQSGVAFVAFLAVSLFVGGIIRREERRRADVEEALRDSYTTLHAMVEGFDGGVYLKDGQGRYRLANSAFARMADRPPVQLVGRTDQELFDPEYAAMLAEADARVIQEGCAYSVEEKCPGGQRICLVTRTPFVDAAGRVVGVIGVRQDITELSQAQQQLRDHEQELAHVDRLSLIGELATGLAHELNQPLGAVVNYSQASLSMVAKGAHDPAKLEGALRQTVEQARRASEIVRRIRGFVQRDKREVRYLDLSALVRDALRFVQEEARAKAVRINFEPGGQLPKVVADPIQIEQVILNLIFNSMDALMSVEAGKRQIDVSLGMDSETKLRVTVADNGPGLDQASADRLFEPFFTTKTHGMGMGLAISRSIIEDHAGALWAESDGPVGVQFHFTLPVGAE